MSLLPAVVAFLVAAVAMFALRPVAIAVDLIDRPGGHKTHHGDVPIVGGLAMLLGMLAGSGLLTSPGWISPLIPTACALLVVVGLADDRFGLSPALRLAFHLVVIGSLTLGSELLITSFGSPLGYAPIVFGALTSILVTVVFVGGAINAFNMLDGVDGLAGAMALIALTGIGGLCVLADLPYVLEAVLMLGGVIAAFLLFNMPASFNRSLRSFMGDGGSTLLGFLLAALCIYVSQGASERIRPVDVLWVVALPIYELLWTIFRRLGRGHSPFIADREHFHHLVLNAGFSVRAAFLLMATVGILLLAIGLSLTVAGVSEPVAFVAFVLCGGGVVVLFQNANRLARFAPRWLMRAPVWVAQQTPPEVPDRTL